MDKADEEYFDLLRNVGILFHCPVLAAETINIINNDVNDWWNNPDRQLAVNVFVEHFCPRFLNEEQMWINEFNRISKLY